MYGAKSLVSTICSRTNELNSAQEDFTFIGKGKPPIEKVDLTDMHEGIPFYMWVVMAVIISIIFISIFKRKKRK